MKKKTKSEPVKIVEYIADDGFTDEIPISKEPKKRERPRKIAESIEQEFFGSERD